MDRMKSPKEQALRSSKSMKEMTPYWERRKNA
jgi:hypothetical protein